MCPQPYVVALKEIASCTCDNNRRGVIHPLSHRERVRVRGTCGVGFIQDLLKDYGTIRVRNGMIGFRTIIQPTSRKGSDPLRKTERAPSSLRRWRVTTQISFPLNGPLCGKVGKDDSCSFILEPHAPSCGGRKNDR
jgi:hypothetical protein